jgi:heme-degrading monooxygenase HmoA
MFEILTFRLAPGVDEATFRSLDERVQVEFAYQQPGFLRRTLGRGDDGRWLVLTLWSDPDAASAAARAFDRSALGASFRTLLADVAVERFHGVA